MQATPCTGAPTTPKPRREIGAVDLNSTANHILKLLVSYNSGLQPFEHLPFLSAAAQQN